jgi:hypothetical protein
MSRRIAARLVGGATFMVALAAQTVTAQLPVLVHMDRFTPHQIRVDVFSIATPQSVQIDATGADERFPRHGKLAFVDKLFGSFQNGSDNHDAWRGNAWIIDAGSRRVVWELRTAKTDHQSEGIREFNGTVHLQPGTYEVYYAAYSSFSSTSNIRPGEHLTAAQIAARTKYDDDGVSRQFDITVRGSGQERPASAYLESIENVRRNALLSLTGLKSDETRKVGFALDRPTRIDIYALGELRADETFDYGWIINADTHEKVWALEYGKSRPAGGAVKNREARASVTLPAGRYAAIYTLDDSHDVADWNSAPPHDPGMWGMTLRLADPADRAHVRFFDYDGKAPNAIVALTGLGDNVDESAGFSLKRAMDVRVYALGEGDAQGMNDYAWITDAKSHKRVWTMRYANTEHAGGSQKNRFASSVVHLEPGNYVVGYRTDESHSAADWNSAPPIDGAMWGVTVTPAAGNDRSAIGAYDPAAEDGAVIAKLVNMEDDEDARATFSLDRPTEIRVYAIGEGRDNQMFDRGFIEERGTRRVVWDMDYRGTRHAGGAAKNRLFDGTVTLPAGSYVLHWKSDDSHSRDGWNESAPEDAAHWGITLYRADGR